MGRDVQRRVGAATLQRALAIVALIALASLIAGAIWWVARGTGDDSARSTPSRRAANPPTPIVDAAAAERTPESLHVASDPKQPRSGPNETAAADDPSTPPRAFHVHLFDESDGGPISKATLLLESFGAEVVSNTSAQWGPEPALVLHSGLQPYSAGARSTAKSDETGDAILEVPRSKSFIVDVLAKGYVPVWFESGTGRGARERSLEVGLAKTATLRGQVVGSDRQPVGGMRILLQFDRSELERPRRPFRSMLQGASGRCETTTAPDGTFEFTGLPGDVELTLNAGADEEPMRAWQQCVWLDPGEERELRWMLRRAPTVGGRVVASDGTPLANATVNVVNFEQNVFRDTTTDALGRFTIAGVPVGVDALQVDPDSDFHAASAVALAVDEGVDRDDVEVRLPDAAPLVVRALDPDGQPTWPAEVQVFPPPQRLFCAGIVFQKRPEEGACARVKAVPLGDVLVRVSAPLTSPWASLETNFHHDGKHECEVRFTAGGRVSGTLVDAEHRDEHVAATTILMRRDGARRFWNAQVMQSTAASGTFDFTGVGAGEYDVIAQSDDGRVGVATSIAVGADEQRSDVVVALAPGATLELIAPAVVLPQDMAVEGRSLRFEARREGDLVGAAFAYPRGRIHLTVPPGRVTIDAVFNGERISTRDVDAKPGQVVRVRS